MKKNIYLSMLVGVIILVYGCSEPDPEETLSGINVAVSAGIDGSRKIETGSKAYQLNPLQDETYFKANRKTAVRGSRKYQITPERFILDIDSIELYTTNENGDCLVSELLSHSTNSEGANIPKHIDLAYADDFVKDAVVYEKISDGLVVTFLPHAEETSNDGYYIRSIVGVSLPAEYDVHNFGGELSGIDGLPEGLRFFGFDFLQPYETNSGFLSFLTFETGIETAGIQNPEGLYGDWEFGSGVTGGNAVSLFFPLMDKIDLTPYQNPEINFNWNLENLVEIWDAGTPLHPYDDVLTFSLTNPFPISLSLGENEGVVTAAQGDFVPPAEVVMPAISGSTSWNTLQWVNPIDEDFAKVVIIRKTGSAPVSKVDGQEVYNSYKPNYVDETGASGMHYYYRIFSVDYSGNYSAGVVLDQVQH